MKDIIFIVEQVFEASKRLGLKVNVEYNGTDLKLTFIRAAHTSSISFNITHEILAVKNLDWVLDRIYVVMHRVYDASLRGGFQ